MLKRVYRELKKIVEKKYIKYNFNLKDNNTYRLSCVCKIAVFVNSIETFIKTMKICEANCIKPVILAQGSNVILKDKILNKVVILFGENFSNKYIIDDSIIVESGAKICDIISYGKANNLSSIERLIGIPASVGGAVYMNASAFGFEISQVINSVLVYSNGKIKLIKASDLRFDYRYSSFQDNDDVILRVELKCDKMNKETIQNIINETIKTRNQKQKVSYPNAGSVFRNGNNYFAGELIDKCGLKNYNIRKAFVSTEHANFIENRGGATGKDILELIEHIKIKVYESSGIRLQLEQKIIGE